MERCSFDGCTGVSFSKGFCAAHYQQQRAGNELKPLQKQLHGLSEYDRLIAWTDVAGPKECWNWTGSRNKKNWHGQWRNASGQIELTHRAAWRLFKGEIPPGMFILHRCDNPICMNPAHLFMGTQSDNARDMWEKRRAKPGTSLGEKHGMSKLTEDIVREIRASKESGIALALRLKISPVTVSEIRLRKTWKHI